MFPPKVNWEHVWTGLVVTTVVGSYVVLLLELLLRKVCQ